MKSLVEAVANIVLFILTPVIMVWVQISLAQVIEKLGELPIEESKAKPGQFIVGLGILRRLCSTLSRSSIAQTAAERSHSRLTLIPGFDVNAERWQSFGFNVQDVDFLVVSTCDAWRAALLELPDIQPFTPRGFGSRLAFSPPESGKGRQKK
jgi:hypothetical protein